MSVDNMTELRKRIPGGKYALTRAIAERAKQLQNGAMPLSEVKVPNPITVAMDEVLEGKVTFEFKEGESDPEPEVVPEAEPVAAEASETPAAEEPATDGA